MIAIRGVADLNGRVALANPVESAPKRTEGGLQSRSAAVPRMKLRADHFNVVCLSGASRLLTLDDFACLARIDAPGSLPAPA